MNRFFLALMLLALGAGPAQLLAQEETMTLDDLANSAQQWAQQNLDEDALKSLGVNQETVRQVLEEVKKRFQGQYVLDLASLRDAIKPALPIMDQYEETAPYAIWLRNRLDELDTADELRLLIPPPAVKPGQPSPPVANPAPELVRRVWVQRLATRPWPEAAKAQVPQLKPIFSTQNVPPELVWVAEVESGFNPKARSPAGAAGMFQLMPATAKRYGLRRWPFDQRLQPEESARAAAQYLKYLHGHYGEWPLALAAYNAGEGTVDKILAKRHAHSFDEVATRLPAETQLYVPKVEATLFRREGLKFNQLRNPSAKSAAK